MYRRIRDLREDSDLTQKSLADYLSCSQVCYSNYETGKRDVPSDVLIRLARFYHTSVDYLVGLTEERLVGTVSVEKSETLAKMLQKYTRDFNVLNAKNHEREAEIVAQAGKKGAITIATNMAGRGTDIMLGGNAEYMAKAQ